jgi:hypothetical protein
MFNSKRINVVITPVNDLEAIEIKKLCELHHQLVLVTGQQWGASWSGLEPQIQSIIANSPKGVYFYGVELQGTAPYTNCYNIDHHRYGDDDRWNPKSSLEQVAELLGVEIGIREKMVVANDRGHIDAMKRLGEKLGLNETLKSELISEIRLADRSAQGITPEQEAVAEEAIAHREVIGDLTIVKMAHSKCATVTDRLYGQYKSLLVYTPGEEINFYGDWASVEEISLAIPGGWSGNGFWGISDGSPEMYNRVRTLITGPDWTKRVGRRKGMIAMAFK